jgi:hypothetical protein
MGGAAAPLKIVSNLLGGEVKEPTPPPPPPPVAEAPLPPDPDDQATRKAQKRRTAEIQARGGRLSTILTEQSGDKLGA